MSTVINKVWNDDDHRSVALWKALVADNCSHAAGGLLFDLFCMHALVAERDKDTGEHIRANIEKLIPQREGMFNEWLADFENNEDGFSQRAQGWASKCYFDRHYQQRTAVVNQEA